MTSSNILTLHRARNRRRQRLLQLTDEVDVRVINVRLSEGEGSAALALALGAIARALDDATDSAAPPDSDAPDTLARAESCPKILHLPASAPPP